MAYAVSRNITCYTTKMEEWVNLNTLTVNRADNLRVSIVVPRATDTVAFVVDSDVYIGNVLAVPAPHKCEGSDAQFCVPLCRLE